MHLAKSHSDLYMHAGQPGNSDTTDHQPVHLTDVTVLVWLALHQHHLQCSCLAAGTSAGDSRR